jgi:hypothetical protein
MHSSNEHGETKGIYTVYAMDEGDLQSGGAGEPEKRVDRHFQNASPPTAPRPTDVLGEPYRAVCWRLPQSRFTPWRDGRRAQRHYVQAVRFDYMVRL